MKLEYSFEFPLQNQSDEPKE